MQDDALAACLAIAQDDKLFNAYTTAAKLLEQLADLPSLAISAFMTSVVRVKSQLDWLENPTHLDLATIEQIDQLSSMLQCLNGYDSLSIAVGVKLVDVRSDLQDCAGFSHIFSMGAAATLAPISDLLNQLGHIAAAGEAVSVQKLNEAINRCRELCTQRHVTFALHFANHGSALFDAYLHQAWTSEIEEQGAHYSSHIISNSFSCHLHVFILHAYLCVRC